MKTPKHIVLISLDTLRGDCVGALSSKGMFLPENVKNKINFQESFLDNLARQGTHYTRCFSAAPYTTASHASIFTGFLPLKHGLYEYYNSKIQQPTVFEMAKKQGRRTSFKTDFPIILGKPLGFTSGVDKYIIEDDKACLDELNLNKDVPTLDFVHFGGIHYPYGFHTYAISGDDYVNKLNALEKEFNIDPDNMPIDQFDESFRNDKEKKLLFRYKNVIQTLYKAGNYARLTQLYVDGISYFVEKRFKPFWEQLTNIYDMSETKVYIFGDHGEEWSDTSEGHYKTLARGVLNVPLLVLGSETKTATINQLVRTVDVGASVINDMQFSLPDNIDGINLSELDNSENRTSVAQTWLGIGKDVLQKHIDKAIDDGMVKEDIPTVKRGETVIKDNTQLLKLYDKQGLLVQDALLQIDTGYEFINNDIRKPLQQWLDDYNTNKISGNNRLSADDELKALFRLQGYKI